MRRRASAASWAARGVSSPSKSGIEERRAARRSASGSESRSVTCTTLRHRPSLRCRSPHEDTPLLLVDIRFLMCATWACGQLRRRLAVFGMSRRLFRRVCPFLRDAPHPRLDIGPSACEPEAARHASTGDEAATGPRTPTPVPILRTLSGASRGDPPGPRSTAGPTLNVSPATLHVKHCRRPHSRPDLQVPSVPTPHAPSPAASTTPTTTTTVRRRPSTAITSADGSAAPVPTPTPASPPPTSCIAPLPAPRGLPPPALGTAPRPTPDSAPPPDSAPTRP